MRLMKLKTTMKRCYNEVGLRSLKKFARMLTPIRPAESDDRSKKRLNEFILNKHLIYQLVGNEF